jgi:hypothetical protein
MIVPVDRTLHPPEGFDFGGQWNCGDGASIAHLEVGNRNRSIGWVSLRLPEPWTEIHESQGDPDFRRKPDIHRQSGSRLGGNQ